MADKVGDAVPRVAAAAASAGQRLKLQTSYGQALAWAKGFAAEETRAAFGRAQELPGGTDAAARFPAYYGKWLSCSARGEMGSARQTAGDVPARSEDRRSYGRSRCGQPQPGPYLVLANFIIGAQ